MSNRALGIGLGAAFGLTLFHWFYNANHETPARIAIRFAETFLGSFLAVLLLELWLVYRNI